MNPNCIIAYRLQLLEEDYQIDVAKQLVLTAIQKGLAEILSEKGKNLSQTEIESIPGTANISHIHILMFGILCVHSFNY